ncbi:MAG: Host attachment protein [Porticoccaceae bacterium]|nr:Host attachment protein [Porticoccaceae bacterium]
MNNVWILVAESSRAKIYQADLSLEKIVEVHDLVHEASRLHERDITTDLPGSNTGSAGNHHRFEPHTSVKTQEAGAFAREVAGILDQGRNAGAYSKLALIAAPDFLGHVRGALNSHVRKLVVHEVDKNMARSGIAELRKVLPKTFFSRLE